MIEINWKEAPDWANGHYLCNSGRSRCWIKIGQPDEPYEYRFFDEVVIYRGGKGMSVMLGANDWNKQFTPRPERKIMELKEFKNSKAYKQIRKFVEVNVPDPKNRPAQLGLMVKRAMARLDLKYWIAEGSDKGIHYLCDWHLAQEKGDFWYSVALGKKVDNINPCPIGKPKEVEKPVIKKEEKPKRVGWWQ